MRFSPFILLLFIGSLVQTCAAQPHYGDALVSNGVFLGDPEIKAVCDLWQAYLHSRPDSLYDNPYWDPNEKEVFKTLDILTQSHLGNIYKMMSSYPPTILSITPVKKYYKIRTMYAQQADSGFCDPLAITNVYAKKIKGKYYLCNALLVETERWKFHTIGSIMFISPKSHTFDSVAAVRLASFADSLAEMLDVPTKHTNYFVTDTKDELYKAIGLDYFMGEGNKETPSGFADITNSYLYGAGLGEWYPHELVHLYVNPKFKTADPYFTEGIATYFGGSKGHSLDWHIRHADSILAAKSDKYWIDSALINDWQYGSLDYNTGSCYLLGGLLCKLAVDKGGFALLWKMMEYGPTAEKGRYKVLKELFGIERKEAGVFLRKKIAEYAAKIPTTTQ
jgi:hypothetical protein